MRDLSRVATSGLGKSRGYAFVNFTEHSDALHALRATNNNAEIFGESKVYMYVLSLHLLIIRYRIAVLAPFQWLTRTLHTMVYMGAEKSWKVWILMFTFSSL